MTNQEIAKILYETAGLLEIKGAGANPNVYRQRAYRQAALALEKLEEDISLIYKKEKIKGLEKIHGVGPSIAQKIEEYLTKGKIKYYEELKQETAIQQIIAYYFETKNVSLKELKTNAKKRKIVYSRFTRPAKQLLELSGSTEKAKMAISKVAEWAKSRNLDYAIETVFKKWLELDQLKPKEIVKKPFYKDNPMVWSDTKKRWYVISREGEWLEFVGKKDEIEWRITK